MVPQFEQKAPLAFDPQLEQKLALVEGLDEEVNENLGEELFDAEELWGVGELVADLSQWLPPWPTVAPRAIKLVSCLVRQSAEWLTFLFFVTVAISFFALESRAAACFFSWDTEDIFSDYYFKR